MGDSSTKQVSFEGSCRGQGKIYALVHVSEGEGAFPITVMSCTRSGHRVPAIVIDWKGPGEKAVVLPILSVSQTCMLFSDVDGRPVKVAERAFHPVAARIESATRSMRGDARFQELRNCDADGARTGCEVSVERIIATKSGELIAHGAVIVSGASEENVAGEVVLAFLSSDGGDASTSDWVLMRDVTHDDSAVSGLLRRVVDFSVRLPGGVASLIAWAYVRNETRPEGFASLLPEAFGEARAPWDVMARNAYDDGFYDAWYKRFHAVGDVQLAAQARRTFPEMPLFSIVVPLYRTPVGLFREMADSVLAQSYRSFELVLVNSTPDDEALSSAVAEYAARDARVRCVELAENRGITENTNAGIKAAVGDFVCFLDHDDLLTPDALYCYAQAVNDYPETDLLYSDEDKVRDGVFQNPFFKPDWNPDMLLSMNYVCHFLCVRKSIIDGLEPPTSEYDGSQDHHLTLRASLRARNIYHARRVLYHWRIVPGSTAETLDAKPYALEAGIRAIQHHLDERGWKGKAQLNSRTGDRYEVVYEPVGHPLVSIIIPNKDNVDMLDRCVRSIVDKSTYDNYEIIVVENNSADPATFEYYGQLETAEPFVRIERFEGSFNYSRINNFGVGRARGDYLLLLNNDTEVITPDWIERMVGLCMREGTGAVGARLLFPDGTVQHAGVMAMEDAPVHIGRFCAGDAFGDACRYVSCQDLSAVTAACLMTSREAFERIGGFDERFAVGYNDVDLCYSLREAGYLVVYEPAVELYHYESVSRGFDHTGAAATRAAGEGGLLRQKWPAMYGKPDPYGNPSYRQDAAGAYYCGFSRPLR